MTTPQFPKLDLDADKMREGAFRFRYGAEQLAKAIKEWGKQLNDAYNADAAKLREARKTHEIQRAADRAQFDADYAQWKKDNNLSERPRPAMPCAAPRTVLG